MAQYKYRLATWAERNKDLRCPQCGRGRRCFKEYLLEDGTPVDAITHICGKCDHESSCGYHLPPSEFYKMNPDQRKEVVSSLPSKKKQRIEMDIKKANKSRSCYHINTFVLWVRSLPWSEAQRVKLEVALDFYNVGTSRDGGVIWWQIDEDMIVRTGKKMLYNSKTGKRRKDDEGNSIGFNWVHAMGPDFKDTDEVSYELVQCLFGEHLLKAFPKATVCVVESEKTAILMSAFDKDSFDKHIWLATGGKYNLQETRLYPLRHRNVILYPDRDAVEDWKARIAETSYTNMIVDSSWIKNVWEPVDGEKADIGDSILRLIQPNEPSPI